MNVDLHVITTLPASNPDPDENGKVKTLNVGGAERAILSSQAMKDALRSMMSAAGFDLDCFGAELLVTDAFTVHPCTVQVDTWEEEDDLNPNEPGPLKKRESTSGTYYWNVSFDVDQLVEILEDADIAKRALTELVKALPFNLPQGNVADFAHNTFADAMVAVVNDRTMTAAPAFKKPMEFSDGDVEKRGISAAAVSQMINYLADEGLDAKAPACLMQVGNDDSATLAELVDFVIESNPALQEAA